MVLVYARALVLASAISIVAAACGGGDEKTPATTQAAPTAAASPTGGTTRIVFDESSATTTPSGLKYIDTVVGNGKQPVQSSTVLVHYRGQLVDGTEFDSSYSRGAPAPFPLGNVIPGFSEGILGMKVGGQRTLYIPWKLGYGETGYPGVIPPRADLIFAVELIEVR